MSAELALGIGSAAAGVMNSLLGTAANALQKTDNLLINQRRLQQNGVSLANTIFC